MKTLSAIVLSMTLLAEPVPDTMARFHGIARMKHAQAAFRSEDLSNPAYFNRFHFLFVGKPLAPAETLWYDVTVAATEQGTMTVAWGDDLVTLEPLDDGVALGMRKAAPGYETRWQKVTITDTERGQELLIEEPK